MAHYLATVERKLGVLKMFNIVFYGQYRRHSFFSNTQPTPSFALGRLSWRITIEYIERMRMMKGFSRSARGPETHGIITRFSSVSYMANQDDGESIIQTIAWHLGRSKPLSGGEGFVGDWIIDPSLAP